MTNQPIRLLLMQLSTLILSITPLPLVLELARPPWILLLVLYTQFFLSHVFNVYWVFALGFCLDVAQATVLGQHAFALLLVTWLASGKVRRFQFFTMSQQMFLIALLAAFYQLTLDVFEFILGYSQGFIYTGIIAVITFLLWPLFKLVGDSVFLNPKKIKD